MQIRRVLGRSTYVDVVSRQSGKKKKEIAEELWKIVRARQSLLRHYDNGVLPRTEDLIEKAGIKASTQHAHAMRPTPRLGFRQAAPPGSAPGIPPEGEAVRRVSLHPDLARQSFVKNARAADRWLRKNPDFASEPVIHPGPQRWERGASTVEDAQVAPPLAGEIGTVNSEMENVEVSIARRVQFIKAGATLAVVKVSTISNPIGASQYLPPGVQSQGKKSAPTSSDSVAAQGNSVGSRKRLSR
jgi:hypothetical protein